MQHSFSLTHGFYLDKISFCMRTHILSPKRVPLLNNTDTETDWQVLLNMTRSSGTANFEDSRRIRSKSGLERFLDRMNKQEQGSREYAYLSRRIILEKGKARPSLRQLKPTGSFRDYLDRTSLGEKELDGEKWSSSRSQHSHRRSAYGSRYHLPPSIMKVRTLDSSLRSGDQLDKSVSEHRRMLRRACRTYSSITCSLSSSVTSDMSLENAVAAIEEDGVRHSTRRSTRSDGSDNSRRSVSFQSVKIREYPIMLGENPAVSSGNAITIGWDPIAERSVEIEIDDYELSRGERRTPEQIILPLKVRDLMLREGGFTTSQMVRAEKEINLVRRRRKQTAKRQYMARLEEIREVAVGAVQKRLRGGSLKERELMVASQEAEKNASKERALLWELEHRLASSFGSSIPGGRELEAPMAQIVITEENESAEMASLDVALSETNGTRIAETDTEGFQRKEQKVKKVHDINVPRSSHSALKPVSLQRVPKAA